MATLTSEIDSGRFSCFLSALPVAGRASCPEGTGAGFLSRLPAGFLSGFLWLPVELPVGFFFRIAQQHGRARGGQFVRIAVLR